MIEARKKILIVDDDRNISEAIRIILEMNNFIVDADDGSSVEKKLEKSKPDLVLLDILLGGRDGREICKTLKVQKEYHNLPIILISAHADAAATFKRYKANDFMAKPFDIDDLLGKINKLLH